jgi:hypothetical protein
VPRADPPPGERSGRELHAGPGPRMQPCHPPRRKAADASQDAPLRVEHRDIDGKPHEAGMDAVTRLDPQPFILAEQRPAEQAAEPVEKAGRPHDTAGQDLARLEASQDVARVLHRGTIAGAGPPDASLVPSEVDSPAMIEKRTGWTALGWAAGLAVMYVLWQRAGGGAAWVLVRASGPAALLVLVPYAFATVLYGLPWGLLLSPDRPRWRHVVASRFAAASVNSVLPSGVFGEPVRLRTVPVERRVRASDALVWDRALYYGASGTFLATAALCGRPIGGWPFAWAALTMFAVYWAAALLLVGVAGWPAARRHLGNRLARRWPSLVVTPALRPSTSSLIGGFLLHFAARSVVATEIWLGAHLLGLALTPTQWLITSAATVLSAAALPMVPGQVGVQEATLTAALAACGLDPSQGLALGLLLRLRQVVYVPLGFALFTAGAAARPAPASPA